MMDERNGVLNVSRPCLRVIPGAFRPEHSHRAVEEVKCLLITWEQHDVDTLLKPSTHQLQCQRPNRK